MWRRIKPKNTVIGIVALFALALLGCVGCKRGTATAPAKEAAAVDPWKQAIDRVEQDRGEAMGRHAMVEVPAELKHYADRRRFLAVQAADSRTNDSIVRDFADVAQLIQRGQLVEIKPLGDDYVLYGVGQNVGGEPFSHLEMATTEDIPLAATKDELNVAVRRAIDTVTEIKGRLAYLDAERKAAGRNRRLRAALLSEVARTRKSLAAGVAKRKALSAFYDDPARLELLITEHRLLANLARDFEGEAYDYNDPDARKRLKTRLLSFIRPEARDVLMRIAHDYKEKYDRPLPVSSLIRPQQYQRELSKSNANAARGPTPPHSTGMAFDLYYGYMNAEEQEYLMSAIVRLKDAGQVEALRESRDNIHVYVFADGKRPDEKLVARMIAEARLRKSNKKARGASRH